MTRNSFTKGIIGLYALLMTGNVYAQNNVSSLLIDTKKTYQTIDNFAASDAWACQFIGNWPEAKKNAIADWLFSTDTLPNGNPKGIGLSMWRFNIGGGSAEQKDSSGIKDQWRRASAVDVNANRQSSEVEGQFWFLQAAQKRGVKQFLGFYNTPPVWLTRNGKGFATNGQTNIDSSRYTAFADYTVDVIKKIHQATGVHLNYISPVNEPQWEWSDGGQEGAPYNNTEISNLIKKFNTVFLQKKLTTRLLLPEAAHLGYLLQEMDKPGKGKQVYDLFDPASSLQVSNLPTVEKAAAAHSYFTTSPDSLAVDTRNRTRDLIAAIPGLTYWQSEYCILGDNAGEIDGAKKDTGMKAALYLAKVVHRDLAIANAAAWQWWIAVSGYDYKDGLIYTDKNNTDGNYHDSKMLWALGNYSRFIRPGMKRVQADLPAIQDVYASAFINSSTKELVCVIINAGHTSQAISFKDGKGLQQYKHVVYYQTDSQERLAKHVTNGPAVSVPAQSIVTVIMK